jgi:hypothetical protein
LVVSPPSHFGQPGVVELDAEAGLADHQAKAEEDEQAGQPDPVRHPGRRDRGQHDRGAGQQDEPEIACRHRRLPVPRPGPGARWC